MRDTWDGLYGQEYVKSTLELFAGTSKVPHALLFQGDEGVGKTFTAIKFAQLLNSGADDFLKVSNAISSFSEPFIKYIFPVPRGKNETEDSGPYEKLSADELQLIRDELEKKSSNPYYKMNIPKAPGIKISSIRDIKKFLSFDFSDISFRTVLISEAHLMNEESQNALLKSLEEPPPGVIFILTTPYPGNLRETIRSRCWLIKFNPLSEADIISILNKYFNVEKNLAERIAPFAGGSITTALKFIENDFDKLLESSIVLLRNSFGKKYHSALTIVEPFLKEQDNESLQLLMNMILIWLNDLQRYRSDYEAIFYKDHKETLEKFNAKFPGIGLNDAVIRIEKLLSLFRNNVNPSIIVLNLIYELGSLTAAPRLQKS